MSGDELNNFRRRVASILGGIFLVHIPISDISSASRVGSFGSEKHMSPVEMGSRGVVLST